MSSNTAKRLGRDIAFFSENDENRAKQEKRLPMNPAIQKQVLEGLKEKQSNNLHEIRKSSAANPPKLPKLGGKTRRRRRKHRKTRHRR
jgi:hypothetical protein